LQQMRYLELKGALHKPLYEIELLNGCYSQPSRER